MKIDIVTVEAVDEKTGFVTKRVTTRAGDFLGRQMPVNNSLYGCEKIRKKHNLSLLNTPIQTHHVFTDPESGRWVLEKAANARQHAKELKRIFIPFYQRNKNQLIALDEHICKEDFTDALNMGFEYVPLVIPEKATPSEVSALLIWANSQLNGTQEVLPVISAAHDVIYFKKVLELVFGKYCLVGIHFMSPNDAIVKSNLLDLWTLNKQVKTGLATSLIVGFNNNKHYNKTKVAGSFVTTRYGVDISSQIQLSPKQVKGMLKAMDEQTEASPEYVYDVLEGGFNKAEEQIAWYGQNVTLVNLSEISVAERLSTQQALLWTNFHGQQEDLRELSQAVFKKGGVKDLVESKSRWHTFLLAESEGQPIQD